jgi:hypothetical protein
LEDTFMMSRTIQYVFVLTRIASYDPVIVA